MKILALALSLLVLVIATAVGLFLHTNRLHDNLQAALECIEESARAQDWTAVRQAAQHLDRLWVKTNAFWSPLMDHRDLHMVDETVVRIVKLAEQRMRDELLVEVGVAARLITRLREEEMPGIGNVF